MKSKALAYFLWLISGTGCLGFHRAYLGKYPTAVLWFFTGGLGYVGAIYDLFTLGKQVDEYNRRLIEAERRDESYGLEAPRYTDAPSLEERVLDLAAIRGGIVTANELSEAANVSPSTAEAELVRRAAMGRCVEEKRASGLVVYRF